MGNFANYLYRARIRKGKYITQEKLSKLSGYTQTYISLLETGKCKPSERCKTVLIGILGGI